MQMVLLFDVCFYFVFVYKNKHTCFGNKNIHLAWECFCSILFGTKTLIKKQTTLDKVKTNAYAYCFS